MLGKLYVWFLEKVLGRHVCQQFTMWSQHKAQFDVIPAINTIPIPSLTTVESRYWQQRRCCKCGKMQIEKLPPFRGTDEEEAGEDGDQNADPS